jgi:hypothetical protein
MEVCELFTACGCQQRSAVRVCTAYPVMITPPVALSLVREHVCPEDANGLEGAASACIRVQREKERESASLSFDTLPAVALLCRPKPHWLSTTA